MEVFAKSYLKQIVEVQGTLFDTYARSRPDCDTRHFIETYMKSRTRASIDVGHAYVCTMYADDLMRWFREHDKYEDRPGESLQGFAPDWIGRFYALYQWSQKISSAETIQAVPLDYLIPAYRGLHDLELDLAVAKVAGGKAR